MQQNSSADHTVGSLFLERFLRRIRLHIGEIIEHRHASYVVEVLYEVAPVSTKIILMQYLVPIYQKLQDWSKHGGSFDAGNGRTKGGHGSVNGANDGNHVSSEDQAGSGLQTVENRCYIARKVMVRCCVEQYLHRPDDWKKMVERQWQVQRLMHQILLQA